MELSVGGVVKIKSLFWFEEQIHNEAGEVCLDAIWLTKKMKEYAGCEAKIVDITNNEDEDMEYHYWLDIDEGKNMWGGWMFEEEYEGTRPIVKTNIEEFSEEWCKDVMTEWNIQQEIKRERKLKKLLLVYKIIKYGIRIAGAVSIVSGVYKIFNNGDGELLIKGGIIILLLPDVLMVFRKIFCIEDWE